MAEYLKGPESVRPYSRRRSIIDGVLQCLVIFGAGALVAYITVNILSQEVLMILMKQKPKWLVIIESFIIVIVYFGLFAVLMWPVLKTALGR